MNLSKFKKQKSANQNKLSHKVFLLTFSGYYPADVEFLFYGLHDGLYNYLRDLLSSTRHIRVPHPDVRGLENEAANMLYSQSKRLCLDTLMRRAGYLTPTGEFDPRQYMILSIGDGPYERRAVKSFVHDYRLRGSSFTITPFPMVQQLEMAGNQWESLERALSVVYKSMDEHAASTGVTDVQPLWFDYLVMPAQFSQERRTWVLKFRNYSLGKKSYSCFNSS